MKAAGTSYVRDAHAQTPSSCLTTDCPDHIHTSTEFDMSFQSSEVKDVVFPNAMF